MHQIYGSEPDTNAGQTALEECSENVRMNGKRETGNGHKVVNRNGMTQKRGEAKRNGLET